MFSVARCQKRRTVNRRAGSFAASRLTQLLAAMIAAALAAVVPSQLLAQAGTGRVAGTVTGEGNQPVPGAQVVVVGTTLGGVTGTDGRYSIGAVPAGLRTVRVQRIGFQPSAKQVTVADGAVSTADFQLAVSVTRLSEVQVQVGYTSERRADVTGAVSSVSGNDIKDQKVATVEEAIRGRVPGVQIAASGEPGRAAQIVIRGQQTLGDPSPLYVVDGMYVGNVNPNINPDDIESIEVLKDASAAAQYGAQASKGVVVIRTRRGSPGATKFSVNSYYGYQEVAKRMDLAGTAEWQRLWLQAYQNAGVSPANIPTSVTQPQSVNTDWQDAIFQRGAIQNYNLAASGGTPTANYLISGSLLDQDGIMLATRFRRASVRANSEARIGRLTVGENLAVSQNNTKGLNNYALIDVVRMLPTIPVYDANTSSGFGFGNAANPTFAVNPVANMLVNTAYYRSNEALGTAYAELNLIAGLRYRLNGGIDYNDGFNRFFRSIDQIRFRTFNTYATLTQDRPNRTNTLVENLLYYDGNFGDGAHRVTAVAGLTTNRTNFNFLRAYRQGFSNEALQQINAGASSGLNNAGYEIPSALNSSLARATYAFRDRYLATASVRQDCSSRFSPSNKCGTFSSGSVGWVVSEEGFFRSIPWVGAANMLKLRASTGTLGDQNIGDFAFSAPVASNINYIFGGSVNTGATQTVLVNENLKWQSNRSSDIGLDLGVLDNVLTLTADYYSNKVSNLLVNVPIPGSLGSASNPLVNAGTMNNAGVELGLTHRLDRGDFRLNSTLNVSTAKNRVTGLGNGGQPIFAGSYGEARTAVGQPIGEWFVRQTCGIFQSAAEVTAHKAQPGAQPGDVCYVDRNKDGVINDDDRYNAGNGIPKLTSGLFLDSHYKAFDVGLNLVGKYGYKIFNAVRIQTDRMDDLGNVRAGYNPWTPQNHSRTTPIALFNNNGPAAARATSNAYGLSDRWLDKGDFTRIQNLIVGYTLPQSVMARFGATTTTNAPRVYLNIQNLHTFTSYPNWDPDVLGLGNPLARGEDDGVTYPTPRTVTFGVDVRF
ncbi:MAG: SusC/RagA family TonB-linked outer membrane protein [Gemmatimonadaceae bacterium]|nr:SusC/RagA family TonB-linked outer membrane protein [Gemmatimonadaceae bacterium]